MSRSLRLTNADGNVTLCGKFTNHTNMLNFRSVYEFVFSSFRISRDTELVDQLLSEGERYGLIIKRSWIYGAFALLWLIPIIAIA